MDSQGNENTNEHKIDFANGVFEVLGCFVLAHKIVTYFTEEFNHDLQFD